MRDEERSPPDDADAAAAKQSIGETLRATREFRRASIEHVSELLRIEPRFLVALEEDRFAAIGPPVFVKGYLKHYAELLGLDPRPLLVELRERLGREEPPLQARRSAEQAKAPSSRAAAVVGIGAAAVLLAAVAVWQLGWLGSDRENAAPDVGAVDASTSVPRAAAESVLELPAPPTGSAARSASGGSPSMRSGGSGRAAVPTQTGEGTPAGGATRSSPASAAAAGPAGVSSGAEAGPEAGPAGEPRAVLSAAVPESGAAAPAPVPSSADRAVTGAVTANVEAGGVAGRAEGAAAAGSAITDRAEGAAAAGSAVTDRAEGAAAAGGAVTDRAEAAAAPAAGAPGLEIELRFVEDSWTEVTSVGGERLFYGLGRAGVEERIRADDEVRVLLGNADGVVVSVDGEPFAYPAGSRSGDLARFRLSPKH